MLGIIQFYQRGFWFLPLHVNVEVLTLLFSFLFFSPLDLSFGCYTNISKYQNGKKGNVVQFNLNLWTKHKFCWIKKVSSTTKVSSEKKIQKAG